MSRIIVHESIHDDVVVRASKIAGSLSVGAGIDRREVGANMGSMVSLAQRDRAAGMIRAAEDAGAMIAAGGRPLNVPGAFLDPTVLTGVTQDMTIANEEVFGPVLSVLKFKTMPRQSRWPMPRLMASSVASSPVISTVPRKLPPGLGRAGFCE